MSRKGFAVAQAGVTPARAAFPLREVKRTARGPGEHMMDIFGSSPMFKHVLIPTGGVSTPRQTARHEP